MSGARQPGERHPGLGEGGLRGGFGPSLLTASFVAAMAALGQACGLPLLLFPELGALASMLLREPPSSWARAPLLVVLTPTLAAVAGIAVSAQLPYGPLSVLLVVALSLLVLAALRSPVAPALSAGYLPLALGIHSTTYPLAILLGLSALVLVSRLARRRASGVAEPVVPAVSLPPSRPMLPPLRGWLGPWLFFLVGALGLVRLLGTHLVLYPPLLVIAWESLAHPQSCPWRGRSVPLLLATTAAAALGLALARLALPQPLAALAAMLLTAVLLRALRLTCPPAFAVALLPLVMPQPPLALPLVVLAGGLWLVLVVRLAPSSQPEATGGH